MAIDRPSSPRAAPAAPGHGLVVPAPGTRAVSEAFARHLSGNLALFSTALGPALPHALRAPHARAVDALRRAYAHDPRATLACLASPSVATPLRCAALRDALETYRARIDASLRDAVPHVLLELALRGLLPPGDPCAWPHATTLASLSLGAALTPPAAATGLRFANGRLEATAGDATCAVLALADAPSAERASGGFAVTYPYRRVGRVARLAQWDHNPIAAFEAHPDKAGNHVDLGGHSVDAWAAMLDDALGLVEAHCPEIFREMGVLLHEIVPVGYDAERHLSASYREAIGTVYLTLHPNVMTMAEALVHEFQHNKLNLASYGAEFLANAFAPLYPSPVRPDPRPLWGIALAVHAFLPVAVLYRRMRAAGHPRAQSADFARRLAELDLKNHEGMSMLRAHARWTPAGRALMDDLEALDRAHMAERAAQGLDVRPTDAHTE